MLYIAWMSEQTAIILLYGIKLRFVYCAVRTELLSVVRMNFRLEVLMVHTIWR